ncbi:hypothetical protein BFW01_g1662 [Lasiodiplodia theobromae]|uniref:Uncharacterized protein n=1 Tax=Lasiodiplodia theobromae TaxID=45133 RepID=A0A5N5D347_9PEZI|nr:uncharacterized protein LTHEOB_8413 [Lasiodiplodia theobromae]KAB2571744.1 hypothetical protein DBV05_g9580 [Lasiodiplodia theobromae]KAF4541832.1 hypothetical protein LTHEOB_8413 [Lasiodiplodia theobromae]KAF9641679.1 hypothetical protein BFW01_g1662 [Lasiodiplodia theobromae]
MDSYSYGSKKAQAAYYSPSSSSSHYYASSAATASSMKPTRGYGTKPGSQPPKITQGGQTYDSTSRGDNTGYWK